MSAVVGYLLPNAASSDEEITSSFPLDRELRAVNDIFRVNPMHRLELVEVALNHYTSPMFKAPGSLLNHTCDHLSPQMWPECISNVLQQLTVDEFLDKHQYMAVSPHATGYWQIHDFLLQYGGSNASGEKGAGGRAHLDGAHAPDSRDHERVLPQRRASAFRTPHCLGGGHDYVWARVRAHF